MTDPILPLYYLASSNDLDALVANGATIYFPDERDTTRSGRTKARKGTALVVREGGHDWVVPFVLARAELGELTHPPGAELQLVGRAPCSGCGFSVEVKVVKWHDRVKGSRRDRRKVTVAFPSGEELRVEAGDLFC